MANLLLAPAAAPAAVPIETLRPVSPALVPAPVSVCYLLRLRPRPRLIGVSGPVSRLLGYRAEDLLSAQAAPAWLLPPADLAEVRSWLSSGADGEADLISRLRHRDGSTIRCRHSARLSRGLDGTWVLAGEFTPAD